MRGHPAVVVERSANWNVVIFFLPVDGEKRKSATGVKHAGVAVAVAVGPAVGATVGVGVGVAVGAGVAVDVAMFGRTAIIADASWVNVTFVPPVNTERIGVN